MQEATSNPKRLLFLALLAISVVYLAYFSDRSTWGVVVGYITAFAAFAGLLLHTAGMKVRSILIAALAFRLLTLVSTPTLSDDYYRFFWDGAMSLHGVNPYLTLPAESVDYFESGELKRAAEGMNSPHYYTVYPPVNQLIFSVGVLMGSHNLDAFVVAMRIILILAEALLMLLLVMLLHRTGNNPSLVALYAFNPLVIVEFSGNLHVEGVVLMFLAFSAWLLINGKTYAASVPLALAISTKLLPLIFLPALWGYLGRKRWLFYGLTGIVTMVTFLPFLSTELLQHWGSSLGLYFKSFEFNASVYYLINRPWGSVVGYNPIASVGPIMAVLSVSAILFISFFKRIPLQQKLYFILFVYLLFATTVHPWYVAPLVAFGLFVGRSEGLVWSAAVVLSYAHYVGNANAENYALIALEYLLVFSAWKFRDSHFMRRWTMGGSVAISHDKN